MHSDSVHSLHTTECRRVHTGTSKGGPVGNAGTAFTGFGDCTFSAVAWKKGVNVTAQEANMEVSSMKRGEPFSRHNANTSTGIGASDGHARTHTLLNGQHWTRTYTCMSIRKYIQAGCRYDIDKDTSPDRDPYLAQLRPCSSTHVDVQRT